MTGHKRRDELFAEAPEIARARRSKPSVLWCKGRTGVDHVKKIVVPARAVPQGCVWHESFGIWVYRCRHVEICRTCGRQIRSFQTWGGLGSLRSEECPDYRPRGTSS